MLDRGDPAGASPGPGRPQRDRQALPFLRDCPPIVMTADDYRERLAQSVADNLRDLSAPEFALPAELFAPTCARLAALIDRESALFGERARAGRIVEGHGDLRPEHICLLPEPQIIDCLEFSRDFRILDPADELGFLALECERLGAPGLKRTIFDAYTELSGDTPPATLVHFYQSYRACMRAKVALWHLKEPALRDSRLWRARARDYLRLAREHVERCRWPGAGPAAQRAEQLHDRASGMKPPDRFGEQPRGAHACTSFARSAGSVTRNGGIVSVTTISLDALARERRIGRAPRTRRAKPPRYARCAPALAAGLRGARDRRCRR